MSAFAPTAQQAAFLSALTDTQANLALVARAGCGKTSTILLGVDAVAAQYPRAEQLVCAFNKSIADEVGAKLKEAGHTDWRTVQAATLHSMGFGLLKFAFKPQIDEKKVRILIAEAVAAGQQQQFASSADYNGSVERLGLVLEAVGKQVEELVRYAKQSGVGYFADLPIDQDKTWQDLADHYDVDGLDDQPNAFGAARVIYQRSLHQTDVIDFDDMILFPLIKNLRVKYGKDFIFLDEAQDLSRTRQELARRFLKPRTGRMIVVGDDRQAIYGFTGADAQALPNLIAELRCQVLPLTSTWRCPAAVVRLAQSYVPDIESAPGAAEGAVHYVSALPDDLAVGDAVLCRNTAPLIEAAYGLIRQGKAVRVEGRAIGDGLVALAQRWKVKTVDALLNKLDAYQEREVGKALAKDDEVRAEQVEDKCETLRQIAQAVIAKGQSSVDDVIAFIRMLFADGADNAIILATYHRSKGREWSRVFLWEHSLRCPSRAAKQQWQMEQEANLAYVAITRAKRELYFVEPSAAKLSS